MFAGAAFESIWTETKDNLGLFQKVSETKFKDKAASLKESPSEAIRQALEGQNYALYYGHRSGKALPESQSCQLVDLNFPVA